MNCRGSSGQRVLIAVVVALVSVLIVQPIDRPQAIDCQAVIT